MILLKFLKHNFYQDIKHNIQIQPGMVLGFSNTVIFHGSQKKPYDLFEKKVDKTISSDIEIRLSEETIIIVYKDEKFQFSNMQNLPFRTLLLIFPTKSFIFILYVTLQYALKSPPQQSGWT